MTTPRIFAAAMAAVTTVFLAACASTIKPSPELVDARRAYLEAQARASQSVPDAVVDARRALEAAERAHASDPRSVRERHLAYLAQRRAQIAIAQGDLRTAQIDTETAENAYNALLERHAAAAAQQRDELADTERELAEARKQLAASSAQLDQQTRELQKREAELEARAAQLRAERDERAKVQRERDTAMRKVEEFAKVERDRRGLVISLSGEVMFPSDETTLSATARERLDRVAEVLAPLDEGQHIIIEGYTDARGPDAYNRALSKDRADAVRAYLITKGVAPTKIVTVGKGESEPVASNETAEGRATNRRVEIVVSPPQAASADTPPAN